MRRFVVDGMIAAGSTKHKPDYKGYKVFHNRYWPTTGRWRAERFGVGMNAGTEQALYRMIDTKVKEAHG